ncbi:MAG: hypothetical protein IKA66_00640 [Candidatus Methanomethylophilaceae archaeon]|nr:hypothetical protein [Candidatus Methanomethylophilaceae archaeon]
MRSKLMSCLALASALTVLLAPVVADGSDAVEGSFYIDQLDSNGLCVYNELDCLISNYESNVTMSVKFEHPVLFETEDAAREYAQSTVNDALVAKYLSSPMIVHLWDLPVTDVIITETLSKSQVSGGVTGTYWSITQVAFDLSMPADITDDPNTSQNEVAEILGDIKDECRSMTVAGEGAEKARNIASKLSFVKVVSDEEGVISNIYDAVCLGKSSPAGIAAAYTYLCQINGLDAVSVAGDVYEGSKDGTVGYWNVVNVDGWYAVDVSCTNKGYDGAVMAGSAGEVTKDKTSEVYGIMHYANLDIIMENDLLAPSIVRESYDFEEEESFLDKYGLYIFATAIMLIIAVTLYHGVRTGEL